MSRIVETIKEIDWLSSRYNEIFPYPYIAYPTISVTVQFLHIRIYFETTSHPTLLTKRLRVSTLKARSND